MLMTREIRGTKTQIAEQIRHIQGEIVKAFLLVEDPAPPDTTPLTEAELKKFRADMEADTVAVDHVDDSREAMYTRMPGE
jgi:hypothetical protein